MTVNEDNSSGILAISGILDIDVASLLRQTFLDRLQQHPEIEVDLSGVEACDSAALQVLIAGQRMKALRFTATSVGVTTAAKALGYSFEVSEGIQHAI